MKTDKLWMITAIIFALCIALAFACGGGDDDDDDDDDDDEPSKFNWEVVDNEGDVGRYNSLAMDSDGNAHIAYYDKDTKEAKYATNKSGSWETEFLPNPNNQEVDGPIALGIDNSGKIHVAFCSAGLWYASRSGSSFTSPQNLDSDVDNSIDIGLEATPGGDANISYTSAGGNLKWYKMASPSTIGTVDETGGVGGSDVAVSDAGSVFMAYNKGNALYYSTTQGAGGWQAEEVDSGGVGGFPSIVHDGSNSHISYHDSGNGHLKYATNSGGQWETSVLDDEDDTGRFTSITIESGGVIHISYYGASSLKYATNFGGVWEALPVDNKVGTGKGDSSIALDFENRTYISYYDPSSMVLKLARANEITESLN